MKHAVVPVWILCVVLAAIHLRRLGGNTQCDAACRLGECFLLLCYSLPFIALLIMHIPKKPSLQRYSTVALFVLIFAISLFLPIGFMPGHRHTAFDGLLCLLYLFVPFFELGLIGLSLLVTGLTDVFCHKGVGSSKRCISSSRIRNGNVSKVCGSE